LGAFRKSRPLPAGFAALAVPSSDRPTASSTSGSAAAASSSELLGGRPACFRGVVFFVTCSGTKPDAEAGEPLAAPVLPFTELLGTRTG